MQNSNQNKSIQQITIIGIHDRQPEFSAEIKSIISTCCCFAGGKRHYELVKEWLPANANWTFITVPLSNLFDNICANKHNWVVFASGDPLFFGIGNTLKREIPSADIQTFAEMNSLQQLGHRFELNYGEYKTISLTGRNWNELDKALIQGEPKMGILTDRKNTPHSIALRLLKYGYSNYKMYYGEHLGGKEERVLKLTLDEALELNVEHPNCLFLHKTDDTIPRKGIPETDFISLEGRPKMITKMGIRLSTLALMKLSSKSVLWDIGACTGSVSIEARLHHPHLKVIAFEVRQESEKIIHENCQKFQTPGIELHMGDYLTTNKADCLKPDAVFLGGYGGKMEEILDDISTFLSEKGTIAFNSVSHESRNRFLAWTINNHFEVKHNQCIQINEHNPIHILIIERS